jgi:hypothetical protein
VAGRSNFSRKEAPQGCLCSFPAAPVDQGDMGGRVRPCVRGIPKMHEGVRLVWYDSNNVIPAKAGIQKGKYPRRNGLLDSRLRGNDEGRAG